jgi:MFS family permease
MYQVEAWSAVRRSHPHETRASARSVQNRVRRLPWVAVGRNVIALGFTSFFTDVSSEMVTTVLPVYLVLHLGLTPLQFGFLDGLYQAVTAIFRVVSGMAADRWRRYKDIAVAGYGLSAICKLGLGAAGAAWPVLSGIVALDRFGKGIRTAPRDALISFSVAPARAASAFGVHRAFDTAGAMLGPLVALALLAAAPDRFDLVFISSFSVAVIGVGVLVLFVQNTDPRDGDSDRSEALPVGRTRRFVHSRAVLPLAASAALLGAATIGDAFVYLLVQRQTGLEFAWFPLLYVGTAGCFLLLAMPIGRLADVIGRRMTVLGGHALLIAAYLLTLVPGAGAWAMAACTVLLGAYYAATDGVFMALASGRCAPDRRASAMAVVAMATSGGRFVAAVMFGALWTRYGVTPAVMVFSVAMAAAVLAAALLLGSDRRKDLHLVSTD